VVVMMAGVVYFNRYDLDRHRHAQILQTLRQRRGDVTQS